VPEAFGWARDLPGNLTQLIIPVLGPGSSPDAPDWRNKERVNVLVMGIDRRPDEKFEDPVRTDVMMLVSVDPHSQTASMLSVPRDLWVPIPLPNGQKVEERINAANVVGVMRNHPGGGPQLAKETFQYNLGVRVHYYVMIDFEGFEKIIDTLGGVDIRVEQTIIDNLYPTKNYGIQRITIPAGDQHLDGERALQYARSRHQDSDFGRMKRQQQVMLAAREKLLRLDMLPKLPQLWGEFQESVRTDMSLGDVLALARVAKEIPVESISGRTLEPPAVVPFQGYDGASLLLPQRERIRDVVEDMFFDSRKEQGARIEVLNGTRTPGLAAQTATQLKNYGFENVTIGDASGGPYRETQVVNFSGKGYTATLVANLLGVPKGKVKTEGALPLPGGGDAVDIRIILGQDIGN
jgi:LCP family protein required for cell wall assembly